jgi:hypothetical protein
VAASIIGLLDTLWLGLGLVLAFDRAKQVGEPVHEMLHPFVARLKTVWVCIAGMFGVAALGRYLMTLLNQEIIVGGISVV